MSAARHFILDNGRQIPDDDCFVGGRPKLPPGLVLPRCSLCGAPQTFFFQIAFPCDHTWSGLTLAVFHCTTCADEDWLIPEMLKGTLPGANIPRDFLNAYQRNFGFEVFETAAGRIVSEYQERIRFRRIRLDDDDERPGVGHVGGVPTWLMEDESPRSYDSTIRMHFLLQIQPGALFETVDGAPPQMELGLTGVPQPSPLPFYRLFLGNAVYLFGTDDPSRHLVYAITQAD